MSCPCLNRQALVLKVEAIKTLKSSQSCPKELRNPKGMPPTISAFPQPEPQGDFTGQRPLVHDFTAGTSLTAIYRNF